MTRLASYTDMPLKHTPRVRDLIGDDTIERAIVIAQNEIDAHGALLDAATAGKLLALQISHETLMEAAFARIEKLEATLRQTAKAKSADARFSFDDLNVEMVDDRNVDLILRKDAGQSIDEAAFRLKFPVTIDRGTWSARGAYERGDGVTHRGSYWIAQVDNPGPPDTPDSGFRLAVKRGKDGRDARP